MTLNEIAYNIKNIVEGGMPGEDSNLSIRQIKHMVNYHRAQLLLKYTDGGRFVSEPMFETQSYTMSANSYSANLVGFINNKAIKEIYIRKNTGTVSENKKILLPIINDCDREFFEESRFAPNKSNFFATINGSTIRIYDNDSMLAIDSTYNVYLTAIWSNPIAPDSGRYPIPTELISSLVEQVLAKEFNVYLRTSSDNTNNSVDDSRAKMAKPVVAASPNANARSRKSRTR